MYCWAGKLLDCTLQQLMNMKGAVFENVGMPQDDYYWFKMLHTVAFDVLHSYGVQCTANINLVSRILIVESFKLQ